MMNIRNIAIFCDRLPPSGGGGVAVWAFELAKGLALLGHRVTVFTRDPDNNIQEIHKDAPFEIRVMKGRSWVNQRTFWARFYGFSYLFEHKNSIIIASTWQYALSFVALRKLFKFRLITAAHSREIAKIGKGHSKTDAVKSFVVSDIIITVSKFIKDLLLERTCISDIDIHIIYNGVDKNRFTPSDSSSEFRTNLGINSSKIILSVGRIVPIKKYDEILKALRKIKVDYTYIIVGDPGEKSDYFDFISDFVRKNHMEKKVIFAGFLDYAKLHEYYHNADLFIQFSGSDPVSRQQEGFSLTVLEALSCGLPAILSDSGGMKEAIIDDDSGVIVKQGDVESLFKEISSFLNRDPKWESFGSNARKRVVENFTWPMAVQKVHNIIEGFSDED